MIQQTKQLYQYLYEVCSGTQIDNFRFSKRDEKMIENFVAKLTYSVGEDWLWNYFCYQFSRYVDLKTRMGKGKVMLNWTIGDKALRKYREATDEEKYWGEEFKNRYNVKNPLLKPLSISINKDYKERERNRFKDEFRRLIHCKENELFDKRSKTCFMCKNKKECDG